MIHQHKYRFFEDSGHGWLEVPRAEVEVSSATITPYSYYNPSTDMAYLEEDCDMWNFLRAAGKGSASIGATISSAMLRWLPEYEATRGRV